MALASVNWIVNRSYYKINDKQNIIGNFLDTDPIEFFNAMSSFINRRDKDKCIFSEDHYPKQSKLLQNMQILASNRSFNKNVTKSLALVIVAKTLALAKQIQPSVNFFASDGTIDRDQLASHLYLFANLGSSDTKCIVSYAKSMVINKKKIVLLKLRIQDTMLI